ncbi:MAG: hypothetical protein U9Q81_21555, partial [Pseudomonadota bacterium]|nr:hypothetical protein [Pseudomonadota bacterium]
QAQNLGPFGVGVLYTLARENCPECGVTLCLTPESTREPIRPEADAKKLAIWCTPSCHDRFWSISEDLDVNGYSSKTTVF